MRPADRRLHRLHQGIRDPDGTLLPIDRIAADRPFCSGKHEKHGMNVQIITDPAGRLVWASPAPPGAVRYIKAARTHGIIDALE